MSHDNMSQDVINWYDMYVEVSDCGCIVDCNQRGLYLIANIT